MPGPKPLRTRRARRDGSARGRCRFFRASAPTPLALANPRLHTERCEERGIHRVEWLVSAANRSSVAVARRLGMTQDGVLREGRLYRGRRHDIEVWSVLAPEWRAAKHAPS